MGLVVLGEFFRVPVYAGSAGIIGIILPGQGANICCLPGWETVSKNKQSVQIPDLSV